MARSVIVVVAVHLCRLSILAIGAVALPGCPELTTFTVPAEGEIEVPGAPIVGANPLLADQVFPGEILSQALSEALQQSFDTQGYDKDAVESLQLTRLTMTVQDAEQNGRQVRGLGFLSSLTVSIGADGFPAVVAAQSEDGAFDGTPGPARYEVPCSEAELKELFAGSDALQMTADVETGAPPNFNTTVKFQSELTVQVNVIGALN
ncbi:MAG: hypothetical protein FJ137_16200 [Deltaproteobacteria bacterium]|nr:hypothetical protein [Deltaproteobacteria bacterium]